MCGKVICVYAARCVRAIFLSPGVGKLSAVLPLSSGVGEGGAAKLPNLW